MENDAPGRLLDAGLDLLATRGAGASGVRATEDAAGVPHGSIRHHFGNAHGFVLALTERLLELDRPRPGESPVDTVRRWLGPDRALTQARYELTVLGARDPAVGSMIRDARDRIVAELAGAGLGRHRARLLVAALDGVVLDGLLRRDLGVDPGPLLALAVTD